MIWINNGCSNVYDAVQKKTGNAEKILNPRREYCVTNMRELALLLKKYAKADILVTIIGDYDCDGVCASAELFMLLKRIGFSNVRIRLPKRLSEGYGLSESIVDEIQQGLIITVCFLCITKLHLLGSSIQEPVLFSPDYVVRRRFSSLNSTCRVFRKSFWMQVESTDAQSMVSVLRL